MDYLRFYRNIRQKRLREAMRNEKCALEYKSRALLLHQSAGSVSLCVSATVEKRQREDAGVESGRNGLHATCERNSTAVTIADKTYVW
jgi:hypothetical protein